MVEVQVPRISKRVEEQVQEEGTLSRLENWSHEIDPLLNEKVGLSVFSRTFSFLAGAFWLFAIGWTTGALYYADGVGTSWIVFSIVFLVLQIVTMFIAERKQINLQKSIDVITAKYFRSTETGRMSSADQDGSENVETVPS